MPEQKWSKRRLNIVACVEGHRGTGPKGEYVIYNVTATDENGAVINQKLSSFQQLPLGPAEFEVAPYVKDGQVKNYTVRKPGGQTAVLRDEVADLRERVRWLEEQVNGLRQVVEQQMRQPSTSEPPLRPPPESVPAYGALPPDDDPEDIPF